MAAHTGTSLSLSGHLLILSVFFIITVPYSYGGSYAILPMKRWDLLRGTMNVSEVEHAVDMDPNSCVTLQAAPPAIDMSFDRFHHLKAYSSIRSVITYLPKHDSTSSAHGRSAMTVTAAHNIRFSVSHTFTSGSNMAYVWSGTGGNSDWIRIELQDEETQADSNRNLTLCEVHVYDVTLSEYCTCDDPCNRNADKVCSASKVCITPAAECPYENVALHKRATMSSKNGNSGDASLAVNGNTGTTFSGPGYTSDTTQWNCMETAVDTDFSPYWAVDLGQNYTVHHITIFRRSDKVCRREGTKDICDDPGRHRMRNTKVMVDGHTCTVITDTDVLELPEKYVTSCQTPLTGREVRLSRDDSSSEFGHVINLCELQVWACKPGRHGDTCQHGTSENSSVENPDCNSQDACTFGSSGTRLELKVWQIVSFVLLGGVVRPFP